MPPLNEFTPKFAITNRVTAANRQIERARGFWKRQRETVPEADPDDARELLNYRSAFEFVSEGLESGDPITEGLIREIGAEARLTRPGIMC